MRAPLTLKGSQRLREELEHLKSVKRPAVIAAIAEARAHGDLKENAEYHAAREQQGFIEGRIKELQKNMANYEQIKKFALIKKGFSIETGELTNTLKIRRAVIMQKYKSIIDEMYAS